MGVVLESFDLNISSRISLLTVSGDYILSIEFMSGWRVGRKTSVIRFWDV